MQTHIGILKIYLYFTKDFEYFVFVHFLEEKYILFVITHIIRNILK